MQAERTIKRVALSDSAIHSLVGSYFSEKANHKYVITIEGDRLNLRIDAQTGMELIPVSDHSLYANEDLAIEFSGREWREKSISLIFMIEADTSSPSGNNSHQLRAVHLLCFVMKIETKAVHAGHLHEIHARCHACHPSLHYVRKGF